jgi:hypothetical protein
MGLFFCILSSGVDDFISLSTRAAAIDYDVEGTCNLMPAVYTWDAVAGTEYKVVAPQAFGLSCVSLNKSTRHPQGDATSLHFLALSLPPSLTLKN